MKNSERPKATERKKKTVVGKKNGNHLVLIPVYLLLTVTLLFVLAASLSKPQNNLIPWQMAAGTGMACAVFLGITFLWNKVCDRMPKQKWIYPACLAIYGILLYLVGLSQGNRRYVFADYSAVYQSALELANGMELSRPEYFSAYANNVNPTLFLSVIFRIARVLHLPEFHFALSFSVMTILAAIWAIGVLLEEEREPLAGTAARKLNSNGLRNQWRFLGLILMAAFMPIYVLVGVFYTDTMSLGWGLIALALLKLGANGEPSCKHEIAFGLLAGIAATYGAEWKVTACIPVLAGACLLLVNGKWRRIRLLLAFLIACLFSVLALRLWSGQYDFVNASKKTSNPLTSWIAIGMSGDGSWIENREFADEINALETKQEKQALTKKYVKEHLGEAFSMGHLIRKARRNYASGMLGAQDFLSSQEDGTITWELMAPWGRFYWRTSQIMFCFMGMTYAIMFLGCGKALICLFGGGKLPAWKMLADVSFLGMFLFLLLWESNNRQLYNQLPVLILGLVTNARFIVLRRK